MLLPRFSRFIPIFEQRSFTGSVSWINSHTSKRWVLTLFACEGTVCMEEGISGGPNFNILGVLPILPLNFLRICRNAVWPLLFHVVFKFTLTYPVRCRHSSFTATLFYPCISVCGSITTFIVLSVNTGLFSFGVLCRVLLMTIIVQQISRNF